LFFEKGKATTKTWFYQLNLDRNLGKTNPLNEKDLSEFLKLQKTKADSENSWSVNIKDIDQDTFDLSIKNPNIKPSFSNSDNALFVACSSPKSRRLNAFLKLFKRCIQRISLILSFSTIFYH
jgi:hypothetical protein